DMRCVPSLYMRYGYRVQKLAFPFPPGILEIEQPEMEELYNRFDELYETAYGKGSGYREAGKEILIFRGTAVGVLKKPKIKSATTSESADPEKALKGTKHGNVEEKSGFV